MAEEDDSTSKMGAKDLGALTKDIIQKDSTLVSAFRDNAAKEVRNVQENYAKKEGRVISYLQPEKEEMAVEYKQILEDNVTKLKEIAKEDFSTSNANAKKLTEETKIKLHEFITKTFNDKDTKSDFPEAATAIFSNINKKVKDDLISKNTSVRRSRASLTPDMANVFVNPLAKPEEELEAERLLQELFESELVQFNEQIKKDFNELVVKMNQQVKYTSMRVGQAVQDVAKKEFPQVKSTTQNLPNLPTTSTVQSNVTSVLNRTKEDFEEAKQHMVADVERRQQQINDHVMHYADKILGHDFIKKT